MSAFDQLARALLDKTIKRTIEITAHNRIITVSSNMVECAISTLFPETIARHANQCGAEAIASANAIKDKAGGADGGSASGSGSDGSDGSDDGDDGDDGSESGDSA
jgi:hypothetical protein